MPSASAHAVRWDRVARYARHRSMMHLLRLPDDVIGAVVEWLDAADLHSLVKAIVGDDACAWERGHVVRAPVPPFCHAAWLVDQYMEAFLRHLFLLSEQGLYYARDANKVVVLADWSPFSRRTPLPLAEFAWERTTPRVPKASTLLHHARIHEVASRAFRKKLPCIRLTLHSCMLWRGETVVSPHFVVCSVHPLFPSCFLASEAMRDARGHLQRGAKPGARPISLKEACTRA